MLKWYYSSCKCDDKDTSKIEDILNQLEQLENKILDIEKIIESNGGRTVATGTTTQIWSDYLEYIRLYGLPPNGIWDQTLLQEIIDRNNV